MKLICNSEVNCYFSPWSILHFMSGILLFFILNGILHEINDYNYNEVITFIVAFIIHIFYEIKDYYVYTHKKSKIASFNKKISIWLYYKLTGKKSKCIGIHANNNSIQNSLGDQISFTIGLIVAWVLSTQFENIEKWKWIIGSIIIYIPLLICLILLKSTKC